MLHWYILDFSTNYLVNTHRVSCNRFILPLSLFITCAIQVTLQPFVGELLREVMVESYIRGAFLTGREHSVGIKREGSPHLIHLLNYCQKDGFERLACYMITPGFYKTVVWLLSHNSYRENEICQEKQIVVFSRTCSFFFLLFFFPEKSQSLNMI